MESLLRQRARLQARAVVQMRIAAANVGRFDLNGGLAFVEELGRQPGVPWVSANLRRRDGSYPFARWRMIQAGETKVGVFGLLAPDLGRDEGVGIEVADPVETAKEAVRQLAGADVVICLSNLGPDEERRLASAVPGITAIVGGGVAGYWTEPALTSGTRLLRVSDRGKYLGVLTLPYKTAESHRVFTLDGSVGEEAEIAAWTEAYRNAEIEWYLQQRRSTTR
jgi:S-sulfosulfanyl-L-cysteine sulfohydrolase